MAKKKKQKKGGLAKKQAAKTQKRVAQKRVAAKAAAPQRQMKPGKVKKLLKNIPALALEPEIAALAFDKAAQKAAITANEKTPDAVDALADEAFMTSLKEKMTELDIRYKQEGDQEKVFLTQAMAYFLDQPAPPCMNQIVVALFYTNEITESGAEVTFDNLTEALDQYDETWADYLEEKAQAHMGDAEGMPAGGTVEGEVIEGEVEAVEDSVFASLLADLEAHLAKGDKTTEEQERIVEDAEVLLVDFAEEKEITELSEISASKVQRFVTGWFTRTMNPTPEDLSSMHLSMKSLFAYLAESGKVDGKEAQTIASWELEA
ncbi:MAG: hypothetical protein QNL04_07165 [SAR324 cluster bacterium]|nr:hypothetical protein [SAR324 cluster bacterium]